MAGPAIDDVLSAAVASGTAPGVVAGARLPGGRDYLGAFGQRGVADPAPMSADTLFWVASMTKVLTSVAALQLIEQGRLSLDQDAAELVPEINDVPVLEGFDAAGAPRLRAAKTTVTLRHLLTHTAGFGYVFMNKDLARYAEQKGLTFGDAMAIPRLFEAGERWEYGINTDLVGQVVEKVSGQTLDVYLKANVFDVLGMKDSTFGPSPAQLARKAAIHARLPDGGFAPIEFPLPPPPNPMMGGGGLYSTAPDYLAFLKGILDGGVGANGRILKPESIARLTTNLVGDLQCGVMDAADPSFTHPHEPMPGMPKRWGVGLLLNQEAGPDGRSAGSGAWAGLPNCYYWVDPAAKVAGVILMQFLPFADPKALAAFSAFERAVYAA
jgi:CubicO group peptidase (beta-lactamase class C family)